MSDEIKQAAEDMLEAWQPKADEHKVARAYLALREQVDTVALPALLVADGAMEERRCQLDRWHPLDSAEMDKEDEQITAATKAIEEGKG
jgi:hypothetical protein